MRYWAIIFIFIMGCKKPPEKVVEPDLLKKKGNVLILNEGLFQWGQSELSIYNKYTKETANNLYKLYNNAKLGDVLQSVTEWNNRLYLVINNSGKIVVVDKQNLTYINTIDGLKSPRKIAIYQNQKAFITDLYSNEVSVYDLLTQKITNNIAINSWTEDLMILNNQIYITAPKSKYVYIIDGSKEKVIDSIETLYGGQSFQIDKNGYIWEACMGDSTLGFTAGLVKINASNHSVEQRIEFKNKNESASRLCVNKDRSKLFYINKHIYSIDPQTFEIKLEFNGNNKQLYGLNCDSETDELYIADAVDYLSSGTIYRMRPNLSQVSDTFKVGIIPNGFYFFK